MRPAYSGSTGRCGSGRTPHGVHLGGHLDHGVVGQERQHAVVAGVHHLHGRPAAGAQQGGDQLDGGLGVERAAALPEQLRLGVQGRVGVHLQQLPLDLGDLGGPGALDLQLLHDQVVLVEVPQVVGGHHAEALDDAPRQPDVVRDLLAEAGEQLRQHLAPGGRARGVEQGDAALPGEVVEADVVEADQLGVDAEVPGEPPLEADRDVAQADGLVPGALQRPGDDADRVGEVDDPRVGVGPADLLGDVQHHRHRTQGLGQAARPGGLLADAAALQRPGLVLVAGRLPADPQLQEHRVGVGDARLDVGRRGDHGAVPLLGEDPPGQPADQLQPVGGRVDQDEFGDRQGVAQPGETVDEFGGVRRTATHDGQLQCGHQPLTPVSVTPSMKAFCAKKKRTITGAITSRVAAMVRFQLVWWAPLNDSRP